MPSEGLRLAAQPFLILHSTGSRSGPAAARGDGGGDGGGGGDGDGE